MTTFREVWKANLAFIQLVTGVVLVVVSVFVIFIAFALKSQSERTEHQALVNCQRALEFGPPLADYFEREHALPADVLSEYRKTIPKSCS